MLVKVTQSMSWQRRCDLSGNQHIFSPGIGTAQGPNATLTMAAHGKHKCGAEAWWLLLRGSPGNLDCANGPLFRRGRGKQRQGL
jgi:hypothetical protein